MKIASIDIGLKRIGIAFSDGNIITPQPPIIRKNRNQASNDLKKFLIDWEIEKLIVGVPMDGNSTEEMKRRITHFVSLLELSIPTIYQDEQNSSQEAKERSIGVFKHSKDGKIDSLAAVIILERYLDSKKV
ncbi:MAG: Holliday junction resolvase RuvX [Sulfurovaceae bacterium]|nr:Holliday junction resolvase RuvX [Sulfurovaceae bacterium]MDD5548568.1 Holliday junction resolvase RuvX [Sulfurovaceae bacterium]